ncbi:MAG: hypothetical protein AB8B69_19600 [Chitinophagales bacterium]
MRFTYKYLLMMVLLFVGFACTQQNGSEQTTNRPSGAYNDGLEYTTLPSGKRVPAAEKGVTVVNRTGWTNEQMEFQQDYCQQSLAGVADVVYPARFCSCFLDKVQFYYNPIYLKEAYTDQQAWNMSCYEQALIE